MGTRLEDYQRAKEGVAAAKAVLAKYAAAGVKPKVTASADRHHNEIRVKVEVRYAEIEFGEAEKLAEIITTLFAADAANILNQGFSFMERIVDEKKKAAQDEARRELDL